MLDFISDEYRDLNARLHVDEVGYGAGSYRWAERVSEVMEEVGAKTVLDYGCGKGLLKLALGNPDWLREYDPAIKGKDAEPEQADLVVCTDVLEHIERDRILNVLEHLRRLAKRAAFLSIAIIPSTKVLADGRNAHLIVEDSVWWKAQIGRFFKIQSWESDERQVIAVVRRLHQIGEIEVVSAVSDSIRYENARTNLAKNKRRLKFLDRHDRAATIVCYGPSLLDTWQDIALERAKGNTIVTVSGAHDFCISRGIIPDVHIDVDPRVHKGYFTKNPHRDIKYWMASCCHPSVIDNLIPYDLTLWNVYNSNEDARILQEIEPDGWVLGGGGSVGCRAVNVMYVQGYRRFAIHGMDCSFSGEGDQHAGDHSGKKQAEWQVTCDGRMFRTSGGLVAVAKGFIQNMLAMEQCSKDKGEPVICEGDCIETRLHGNGLLVAMIRAGTVTIEQVDASAYVKPDPDVD